MANHIPLGGGAVATEYRNAAKAIRVAFDTLRYHRDAMAQMITGDQNQAASYAAIAAAYGMSGDAANDDAKRLFQETDSTVGTDASSSSAALLQLLRYVGP